MLNELLNRYPLLCECKEDIEKARDAVIECYEKGGKLLLCGNGGSCADCEHIVGELMKGFLSKRPLSEKQKTEMKSRCALVDNSMLEKLQQGLPAIALTGHAGLTTAFMNDVDGSMTYAEQVLGYGKEGDVFLGISTSGNSKNVLYAAVTAKAKGLKVIGLLGRDGGRIRGYCDTAIVVPEQETFKIQELHLPIYHILCLMLEEAFFEE